MLPAPQPSIRRADLVALRWPPGPAVATPGPVLTRRSLRYALGVLWLVDGLLQLQPFMFTRGFAHQIVAPTAIGQPFFVADPVHWNVALIGIHPALFNAVFAGVQLALGIGLLLPRTWRLALVGSVFWAGGVWYLGEGLGGLAGGHVSGLVGAPGAALLYGILALAAWPGQGRPWGWQRAWPRWTRSGSLGWLDRSPSDTTRPPGWILRVWATLWIGYAALSLLPANGSSSAIDSQLSASASTVPPWLAQLDRWEADAVHGLGSASAVVLIVVQLAVGLVVLRRSRLQRAALWTGIVLALLYWAGGQSFGQLFSGQATDPSTGPLLVLLGLAGLGALRVQQPSRMAERRTARRDPRRLVAAGRPGRLAPEPLLS